MSESDLYNLLQGAGDAAFVVDQGGLILFWNFAAEALFGLSQAQVLNKQCAAVLDGCDCTGARVCTQDCAILDIARRNGRISCFDVHVKTAGEERKWVNMSILTARAGGKQVIVHLVRNVDAEKRVQVLTREIAVLVGQLTGCEPEQLLNPAFSCAPMPELTSRESAVLQWLARGAGTAEIAYGLKLNPATVRNHVQHLFRKLRAHTRLQAVLTARNRGLV